jgi:hypothetical protein
MRRCRWVTARRRQRRHPVPAKEHGHIRCCTRARTPTRHATTSSSSAARRSSSRATCWPQGPHRRAGHVAAADALGRDAVPPRGRPRSATNGGREATSRRRASRSRLRRQRSRRAVDHRRWPLRPSAWPRRSTRRRRRRFGTASGRSCARRRARPDAGPDGGHATDRRRALCRRRQQRTPADPQWGWKATALSINPEDAQLLESRGFSVEEVCRFFGVPPVLVGHSEKQSSWGTGIEQIVLGFLKFTMRPRLRADGKGAAEAAADADDRARGIKIEFNVEGLLRASSKERAEFYGRAMTQNRMDGPQRGAAQGEPAADPGRRRARCRCSRRRSPTSPAANDA